MTCRQEVAVYGSTVHWNGEQPLPNACYFGSMQKGVTLLELLTALVILGLLTGLAAPTITDWSDKLAVMRASEDVASFHSRARLRAVFGALTVRMLLSPDSLAAVVDASPDSVLLRAPGPARRGVRMSITRSTIRLYPNGLGLGGSNTKVVLRKGQAAESLTVSRLGRLKRWP